MSANRIFFIQKSVSPYTSFLPRISMQICQVHKRTRIRYDRRSLHIHYTHRAIFRSIIRSTKVGHVLHLSPLSPPLANFIPTYIYEFYEILVSPWEIITLIPAITDWIRPNSLNTPPVWRVLWIYRWYSRFGESVG